MNAGFFAMVAVGVLFGANVWFSLATGRAFAKYRMVERSREPDLFWTVVWMSAFASVFLLGFSALVLLDTYSFRIF